MDWGKILKWNNRLHTASKAAQTVEAVSYGGAFASDIVVKAGEVPDGVEFVRNMVGMFKIDQDGVGPRACLDCDALYIGTLNCPECEGVGEPLNEDDCDENSEFAGDPFAANPFE